MLHERPSHSNRNIPLSSIYCTWNHAVMLLVTSLCCHIIRDTFIIPTHPTCCVHTYVLHIKSYLPRTSATPATARYAVMSGIIPVYLPSIGAREHTDTPIMLHVYPSPSHYNIPLSYIGSPGNTTPRSHFMCNINMFPNH